MANKYRANLKGAFKLLCSKAMKTQSEVAYNIGLSRSSLGMRFKKQQFNPYYIATLLADELDYDLIIRTKDGDEIIIKEPLPEGLAEKIEEYKATHEKPTTMFKENGNTVPTVPVPTPIIIEQID